MSFRPTKPPQSAGDEDAADPTGTSAPAADAPMNVQLTSWVHHDDPDAGDGYGTATGTELEPDTRLILEAPGLIGAARAFGRRLAQGELGNLPVLLGIIIIWSIFQFLNPRFLSPVNLTNLVLQIAAMGTISVGIVLVLLLGEIDLSVGSVSGFAAATMAVLNVQHQWAAAPSIAAAIAVGILIGAFQGAWITKLRVPSFVVTLAGLLAWQGALLYILGSTGTINISDPGIVNLTGTFFGPATSWLLAVGLLTAYVTSVGLNRLRRRTAGVPLTPWRIVIARMAALAIIVVAATITFGRDRGLPLAAVILVGFVVLFDQLTRRTRWGRHLFAVGGNAEAARRAGISVDGVRMTVFTICSAMAAIGGVLASSRLLAVNQSSGGSDLLLNAIAAAVIGGTSLFGGRGSAWSALLGAVVIGSISNGMDLLNVESSVKFMVTGAVLLAAVTIDAVSRRGRATAGRF
jgi:D-xylose transport system permease protein